MEPLEPPYTLLWWMMLFVAAGSAGSASYSGDRRTFLFVYVSRVLVFLFLFVCLALFVTGLWSGDGPDALLLVVSVLL